MAWIVNDKDINSLLVFNSKPRRGIFNEWKGSEPNDNPCAIILCDYKRKEICDMFGSEHIDSGEPFEDNYGEIIKFLGSIISERNDIIETHDKNFRNEILKSYWKESLKGK